MLYAVFCCDERTVLSLVIRLGEGAFVCKLIYKFVTTQYLGRDKSRDKLTYMPLDAWTHGRMDAWSMQVGQRAVNLPIH